MTLSDVRNLGFQGLGDPSGKALFFFHGTPGSRLGVSETDPIARIPGIRLITPERPGYGISDPKPDRVLLDWARDVAELDGALRERFGEGPAVLSMQVRIGIGTK